MKPAPLQHTVSASSRRTFLRSTAFLALSPWALSLPAQQPQPTARTANATGRRIGFVDDNLENYHANVFIQALRGPLKDRGFTVAGCTALKEAEGRLWAQKNNVPYFDDMNALNAAVDCYMVLAPSTPHTHLELCEKVFPFQKPVYVDKTFAPDLATAKKIFGLADRHGTPVQTTSALRYTNVQEAVRELPPGAVRHMITWGGGSSFDEYAVHPVELLISVMGHDAREIMRRGAEPLSQLLINFGDNRTGVVNVFAKTQTPFAASFTTEKQTRYIQVDDSKIFVNNMAALLDFFESGKPNVDRRESLAIMRILDAARNPEARQRFVPLEG